MKPESVKVEIQGIEANGLCSLSGKEGEVLVVTFSDGTACDSALSLRSFMQLLRLKLGQKQKVAKAEPRPNGPVPAAVPVHPK